MNASSLPYCFITSWLGRLVRWWVVGSVGGSVRGWMIECVRGYGCLMCCALWFSGPMVSPLDDGVLCVRTGYRFTTAVRHLLYCCITRGGWVDRFVGVPAVPRTAILLWCCNTGLWVGASVRSCGVVAVSCSHGFVGCFFFLFFLPLYRPRAGIVERATSAP